jgi:hypothetical protein
MILLGIRHDTCRIHNIHLWWSYQTDILPCGAADSIKCRYAMMIFHI